MNADHPTLNATFEQLLNQATGLDAADPLARWRQEFNFPQAIPGTTNIYLCGHSLGAQPKAAVREVEEVMKEWGTIGIGGFTSKPHRWMTYPFQIAEHLAGLVGAGAHEVHPMNTLTVNLHVLMASFYKPQGRRHKILMEYRPFPSDVYAFQSQLALHGHDPADGIVELIPRPDEDTLRTEDILATIDLHRDDLALIVLGGVNYLTGQLFDLAAIAQRAQQYGITFGVDLAHAVGNVPLRLHDWGVDFAAWCTYKYLNSGPGAPGAVFVHEKHHSRAPLERQAGWWGNAQASRFMMRPTFEPAAGAAGWAQSTPTIVALAPLMASSRMFAEAGIDNLRIKSLKLTGYLESLLLELPQVKIVTPRDPHSRGAMLCLRIPGGRAVFDRISAQGIVADWREPDIIRVAPAPMYNTYSDVAAFARALRDSLAQA